MKNNNDNQQQADQVRSRRGIFKWFGQVAAGAAVAGVGLNAMNVGTASATGKQQRVIHLADKNGNIVKPYCYSCEPGCNIISCGPNGHCRAQDPQNPILSHYSITYGTCYPNCVTYYYYSCGNSCYC